MIASTWKFGVIGVAVIIALVAVNANVTSYAREQAVTHQRFNSELPAAFETNPILGSDAAISTYGFVTGHVTDW
jgi:hypothetical protein